MLTVILAVAAMLTVAVVGMIQVWAWLDEEEATYQRRKAARTAKR